MNNSQALAIYKSGAILLSDYVVTPDGVLFDGFMVDRKQIDTIYLNLGFYWARLTEKGDVMKLSKAQESIVKVLVASK